MNSKKLYFTFIGVLVLLGVGIILGVFQADSLLQKYSKTLVDKKAESAALDAQQTQLIRDKKDITKYDDLNTIAKSIVPQDKDQAEAVRQIVKIAHESNIPRLSSITFPVSTLGGSGVGAARNTGNNKLTQLTPVKGIAGVYSLPITVVVNDSDAVPYSTFIKFLSGLEKNRRTAQVSSITVVPSTQNLNNVSFTLMIDEYIKP